jgi:hypothetical protein
MGDFEFVQFAEVRHCIEVEPRYIEFPFVAGTAGYGIIKK